MIEFEFVIALTEHRFLGNIFQPYLIQKKEQFYDVERMVRPHDFNTSDYQFKPFEIELVNIIERYSNERLMREFSRAANVTEFYSKLKPDYLEKQIIPFIEECMTEIISVLMLSPVRLFKKDSKYSNLYEEDIVAVSPFYARPEYNFVRTKDETSYKLKVFLEDKELYLRGENYKVIVNNPCLLLRGNQLISFEKLNSKKLTLFFEKDSVVVPNTIEEKYYGGFVLNAIRDYDVKTEGFLIKNVEVEREATLSFEQNLKRMPVFVLKFKYGNEIFQPSSNKKVAVTLKHENGEYVFYRTLRNFNWENEVLENLKKIGLNEDNGNLDIVSLDSLEPKNAIYYFVNWLNDNKSKLIDTGINIIQDKLEKNYYTGSQKLEMQTITKGDWFDVYAVVHFGDFSIPFIKLKKYILNNIREFVMPNGEIAILPEEWFTRFKGVLPFGTQNGDNLQFKKHHFMLLQNASNDKGKSAFSEFEDILNGENKSVELPQNLNAKLRNYQEVGFNWMHTLYLNNFGGCLADDMGLGKTLQALTLLLKLKRQKTNIKTIDPISHPNQLDIFNAENDFDEETQSASLIVVPTSLVHNWQNEIKKFTPDLKVFVYVGPQRKKITDIAKIVKFYDVILTTYGTVRNDSKILSKTEFLYLILDESQYVKNASSKSYKAIMELRGKHRLVITGTPIENSLSDLWSQMNFLNPGIFGTQAFFKKSFITPIEKRGSEEQQEKLQIMIRPFILRRKKSEVAKDLPPVVEQILYCPMEGGQKKMYESEKSTIRNAILSSIESEGIGKSSIVVLQGLTKLRQLANHPSLIEDSVKENSGKFDEIFRMLHNLVAEKHKVLIFSSFVKHLELIQDKIEQENWKFSKLTGQTTKRENVIKEFQDDAENRIFLISLKAGGVGLNLTEADYVFILDPWWNPAAENQAINRAHRIGQDKNVFVYRFITENSIEEKIQKLKERKSSLADMFINSNNPFKKISKDEIVELFE
ncbi:MAG: ATP-dependent helicase [Draconibacterium sp.]|nr:ATP-dependent helicase [Draconibacterium sp.]